MYTVLSNAAQQLTHTTDKHGKIVCLVEFLDQARNKIGMQRGATFLDFIGVFVIDIESEREGSKRITGIELGKREPVKWTKTKMRRRSLVSPVILATIDLRTSTSHHLPSRNQDPRTCSLQCLSSNRRPSSAWLLPPFSSSRSPHRHGHSAWLLPTSRLRKERHQETTSENPDRRSFASISSH